MNKFEQFFVWLFWRTWPIWGMAVVAILHLLVVLTTPADPIMTNKIASAAMQIVGGLIVIFSVDSNLGLFRNQSLIGAILAWCRECPLRKLQPVLISIASSTSHATASGATVRISTAATIEEKVAELKQITDQMQKDIEARHQTALARIDEVKQELNALLTANQGAVHKLEQKVEAAAVGSFKQQAFGVMLAVWGAGTSVFA